MAFNVFDFATDNISYAKRSPVVYMNAHAASRILDLARQLDRDDSLSKTKVAEIKKEIKALKVELEKSKVTFHVEGFSPAVRQAIDDKVRERAEAEGWDDDRTKMMSTFEVFANAIRSVEGPNGEEDTTKWTAEDVERLMESAPNGALEEFTQDLIHVTVSAIKFHESVDVPF